MGVSTFTKLTDVLAIRFIAPTTSLQEADSRTMSPSNMYALYEPYATAKIFDNGFQ